MRRKKIQTKVIYDGKCVLPAPKSRYRCSSDIISVNSELATPSHVNLRSYVGTVKPEKKEILYDTSYSVSIDIS